MSINFKKYKEAKDTAEKNADSLLQFIKSKCSKSSESLKFLDNGSLKKEVIQLFFGHEVIKNKKREKGEN